MALFILQKTKFSICHMMTAIQLFGGTKLLEEKKAFHFKKKNNAVNLYLPKNETWE